MAKNISASEVSTTSAFQVQPSRPLDRAPEFFTGYFTPLLDRRVNSIAQALGLTDLSAELRQELTDVVWFCCVVNASQPLLRYSELGGAVAKMSSAAEKVSQSIRALCDAHESLPASPLKEALEKLCKGLGHDLSALSFEAARYNRLSVLIARQATQLKDKDRGGQQPMYTFHALLGRSVRIYSQVTRKAATAWFSEIQNHSGGRFMDLLNAVLPLASNAVVKFSGQKMKQPRSVRARVGVVQRFLASNLH